MGTIIITGNKGNGGGLPPQQKIDVAAEGIKFSYSTFEEVPEIFDFSNVEDANNMFNSCMALTIMPKINWNSLLVARYMFSECSKLDLELPEIIPLVTDLYYAFNNCSKKIYPVFLHRSVKMRGIYSNSHLPYP